VHLAEDVFFFHITRDASFIRAEALMSEEAKGFTKKQLDNAYNIFQQGNGVFGISPESSPFLKKLTGNTNAPFILRGGTDIHTKMIESSRTYSIASQWKRFYEANIINQPEIKALLENSAEGQRFYKSIKRFAETVGGELDKTETAIETALNRYLGVAQVMRLGSISAIGSQAASKYGFLADVPANLYYALFAPVDKAFVQRAYELTPYLSARGLSRTFEPYLPEYAGQEAWRALSKDYRWKNVKDIPAKTSDTITGLIGYRDRGVHRNALMLARAVLLSENPNLKGDELARLAGRWVAERSVMTQVATNDLDRPDLQRAMKGRPLKKMMGLFWSARAAQMNVLNRAFYDLSHNPSKAMVKTAMLTVVMTGLVQSLHVAMWQRVRDKLTHRRKEDEDDDPNEVALMALMGLENLVGVFPNIMSEVLVPPMFSRIYSAAGMPSKAAQEQWRVGRQGILSGMTSDINSIFSGMDAYLRADGQLRLAKTRNERNAMKQRRKRALGRMSRGLQRQISEITGFPVWNIGRFFPTGE